MKYSARLVTALAALVLLAGAIVGLSTRAQAASSPPALDMASAVVQTVDLPVTLDLEGGGTGGLAITQIDAADHGVGSELDTSLAFVIDQSQEVRTTQVITSSLAKDIGAITVAGLVVLAAIAYTNSTTRRGIARLMATIKDTVTRIRMRRHGADAPIASDVEKSTRDDGQGSSPTRDTPTGTTSARLHGQGAQPLRV